MINTTSELNIYLSMLLTQIPMLLVSLAGVAVILARWNQVPRASMWALAGFGLVLILCIVMPAVHTLVQHWVMQGGDHHTMAWVFSVVGLINSFLHAASYVLVLVAVYVGRSPSQSNPMP